LDYQLDEDGKDYLLMLKKDAREPVIGESKKKGGYDLFS